MKSEIIRGDHPIGPTFVDELCGKGGLIGHHFSWSQEGVMEFFDDTPQEVVDGVMAVYAAHDPTKLPPPAQPGPP